MKHNGILPFIICLFFSINYEAIFAQSREDFVFDIKVDYTLRFKKDSLSHIVDQLNCELLINNKQSLFRSEEKAQKDLARYQYLFDRSNFKGGAAISIAGQFKPDYTIIKDSDSLFYFQGINAGGANNMVHFYYSEPQNVLDWDLLTDTMTVMGYRCQKAVVDYGGRRWEAWFSTEIPISDGPYKFCGLPGLIVTIEDATSSWKFELTKFIRKESRIAFNFDEGVRYRRVTRTDFLKQAKSLLKNHWEIRTASQNGTDVHLKGSQLQKKQISEQVKRDNNWIELYP
ncbi:GLPGLI family protein [Sphingobacterium griseoflavum]|uniref:GLPGLI family protein n=1 Tax=Sphingobacterium griseoflavum TaxID=1474952 RepID=A0ABQ3HX71_9SPHI|nr:GLPGLI family protein [Sphingobacterium griseoflavum]GHE31853.1 hypothetical protein GCM10017764_13750 [Sphingobacterium griseoflavum]